MERTEEIIGLFIIIVCVSVAKIIKINIVNVISLMVLVSIIVVVAICIFISKKVYKLQRETKKQKQIISKKT